MIFQVNSVNSHNNAIHPTLQSLRSFRSDDAVVNMINKIHAWLRGRWSRTQFNIALIKGLCLLLVGVAGFNYFGSSDNPLVQAYLYAFFALVIALNFGFIAISILRLHDLNFSGWWVLLSYIPFVCFLLLIVLVAYPSSKGPNKFGQG